MGATVKLEEISKPIHVAEKNIDTIKKAYELTEIEIRFLMRLHSRNTTKQDSILIKLLN